MLIIISQICLIYLSMAVVITLVAFFGMYFTFKNNDKINQDEELSGAMDKILKDNNLPQQIHITLHQVLKLSVIAGLVWPRYIHDGLKTVISHYKNKKPN